LKEVEGYSGRSIRNLVLVLDKKRVKPSKKLRQFSRLLVYETEKGTNIEPVEMDLKIVYEDENLLIIDKEPFLVTHPTLKKVDKTLAHGVVHHFEKNTGKRMVPRFFNRLDMNTSGLIVVAKNAFSQAYLQDKVETRKFYMAIVKGVVEKDDFFIESPIGRVGESLRREILAIKGGGQEAKTHVRVLKSDVEQGLTLLELELFTGRTHQIRVHLSSIGHPILGDELYGGGDDRAKRQLLHSYKFIFENPASKKEQVLEIGLPEDMKNFFEEF
jgi:23S rRNA pseudouridine1911/1915/1917 synthase